MREQTYTRNTNETQISIRLNLDGSGIFTGQTNCGFLNHMLALFTHHARFDMDINAVGDIDIDDHHLVEDVGITLGTVISNILQERQGIYRYGNFLLPMDEALVLIAIDISGRSYLGYRLSIPTPKVGTFDTELVEEFFLAFTRALGCTLHIQPQAGKNAHHIIEATFKGVGRALKQAVSIDETLHGQINSTKGTIV